VKIRSLLSVLFLAGLVSASLPLSGNGSWESIIGGELGGTFGIGNEIMMGIFVLAFIFIWSSVSGIAWDGIFFLMAITIVILAQPKSGLLGIPMWSVFSFIFALIVMGVFFRMILRRG
jgi:hypothetical protein